MEKKKAVPVVAGVVVALGAVVAVLIGLRADHAASSDCHRREPVSGAWSKDETAAQGLRVFRETCARCHGFSDDGGLCLRVDAELLPTPLPEIPHHELKNVDRVVKKIMAHEKPLVPSGDVRIPTLPPASDINAVAKLIAGTH